MRKMKLIKNPFGGTDSQAMNDQLEEIVGINGAFRLLYLMREAGYAVSGDKYVCPKPKRTQIDVFRRMAKNRGFSDEAIEAYVFFHKHA